LFDTDVAAEIDGVRRALGSSQLSRIPPHITVIPPLNLPADVADEPERLVREVAATLDPFSLHIGAAGTFADNPGVLFFAVEPSAALDRLRDRLHAVIPAAKHRDRRSFVPHVTLVSHRDDRALDTLAAELSNYSRDVRIEAVTLMTQVEEAPERPWRIVATYDLGRIAVVGRGGVEVVLYGGSGHSDALDAALERWSTLPAAPLHQRFADSHFALATLGGTVVGVAKWRERFGAGDLEEFVVAPESRGLGIGTRLLDFVEAQLRAHDVSLLRAYCDPDSLTAQYLQGRGFAPMGDVALVGDERRGFAHVLQ
jgi:2'-5' RNA ligase